MNKIQSQIDKARESLNEEFPFIVPSAGLLKGKRVVTGTIRMKQLEFFLTTSQTDLLKVIVEEMEGKLGEHYGHGEALSDLIKDLKELIDKNVK